MWGSTRIPSKVYQVLYPFKRHFRCVQAPYFLVFCWLVMALIRAPGKGTLKGLRPRAFNMCRDVATPNLYAVAQQNCLQAPDTKTTVMGRRSGSSSSNDDVERAGPEGGEPLDPPAQLCQFGEGGLSPTAPIEERIHLLHDRPQRLELG